MKQGVGKYIKTPAKVYVYRKTEGDSVLASSAYKKRSTQSMVSDASYDF